MLIHTETFASEVETVWVSCTAAFRATSVAGVHFAQYR